MISFFYSTNKFWFTEKFLYSIFTGIFLFFYILAYRSIEKDQNKVISDFKKFFLLLSLIQILVQFTYYFLYPFSFLYYCVDFLYCTQLVSLINHLIRNIDFFSKDFNNKFDKFCIFVLGFLVVTLFVSIIELRSENQCGQNMLYFRIFIIFTIWITCLVLIVVILKQISEHMDGIFERKSIRLEDSGFGRVEEKTSLLGHLRDQRRVYVIFFFSILVGGLFKIVLQVYKLGGVHSEDFLCRDLFGNRNFVFYVFFCLCEIIGDNSVNLAIFYVYYWCLKNQFVFVLDSKIDLAEGFGHTRSLLIRDYVYKPDHSINSEDININ